MKKIGIILLGIGFGIICYILFSLVIKQQDIVSPLEEIESNKIIKQNIK